MTLKHLAAFAAVAALAAPTAATAGPGKSDGKGKSGQAKKKGHSKAKNAVFKGAVVSVDAATGAVTVKVDKANKWGRSHKGTDVAFTTAGVKKFNVPDDNADGKRDLADVVAGDKVQVHARITKDAAAPFAARKFKEYSPANDGA